jgi:hypothetical protein
MFFGGISKILKVLGTKITLLLNILIVFSFTVNKKTTTLVEIFYHLNFNFFVFSFFKFYEQIVKDINCSALFSNPYIDAPSEFDKPPVEIPTYL